MKFPITRETLQAFDHVKDQEEMREEEIQKRFAQILDSICKEFKQSMPQNSKEKKFVWRELHNIRNLNLWNPAIATTHCQAKYSKTDEHLSQFVDKLKEIFIGCDIIIDPLKTYLIIDWS
jgi:hypothetical protein